MKQAFSSVITGTFRARYKCLFSIWKVTAISVGRMWVTQTSVTQKVARPVLRAHQIRFSATSKRPQLWCVAWHQSTFARRTVQRILTLLYRWTNRSFPWCFSGWHGRPRVVGCVGFWRPYSVSTWVMTVSLRGIWAPLRVSWGNWRESKVHVVGKW